MEHRELRPFQGIFRQFRSYSCACGNGQPEVGNEHHGRSTLKSLWGNAHDRAEFAVDVDCPADYVRIRTKIVFPKAIANDDRRGSLRGFIACIEQASYALFDAKRREISRRDDVPPDSLGVSVETDTEWHRSDVSRG